MSLVTLLPVDVQKELNKTRFKTVLEELTHVTRKIYNDHQLNEYHKMLDNSPGIRVRISSVFYLSVPKIEIKTADAEIFDVYWDVGWTNSEIPYQKLVKMMKKKSQ
jgi:hypothetical protein